jgi:hypothetical protein
MEERLLPRLGDVVGQRRMVDGEHRVGAADLTGGVGCAEQRHHGLAAGGAGQFLRLAHQFQRRVGELAPEVVGQHEDVVRHRGSLT